jgi:hypothetical protein
MFDKLIEAIRPSPLTPEEVVMAVGVGLLHPAAKVRSTVQDPWAEYVRRHGVETRVFNTTSKNN